MFKVKVITIGKCKETWLLEALADYEKRLKSRVQIEWVLVNDDEKLNEAVKKESFIIALDPKGELLSSEQLSKKLMQMNSRITFVIGGATGLSPEIISDADWRWSLSPLTFTHQMTRIILLEQLYRALEIDRNSPYHK